MLPRCRAEKWLMNVRSLVTSLYLAWRGITLYLCQCFIRLFMGLGSLCDNLTEPYVFCCYRRSSTIHCRLQSALSSFTEQVWPLQDYAGTNAAQYAGLYSIARAEPDGTRAETRIRLSPKRTVGASVQSTARSRVVRISLSNAG